MALIGVFGGSFNPIHFGHLLLADEIAEALALDRVLFVPAARPPHKPAADLAPAQHRFQMTSLAVRGHPRFAVSAVEIERAGPSFTVDTLEALRGEGDLHLLLGSETFLDLLNWRDPAGVARLARLVIVPRCGGEFDPESPAAQKVLAALGLPGIARVPPPGGAGEDTARAPLLVAATSLPLSGSDLRRRAALGRSLAFRVPPEVDEYIRAHRLYRAER